MSIVVTGATGFVGAAFVRACRRVGIEVIPVTRSTRSFESGLFVAPNYSQCPRGDILVHLAEERDVGRADLAEGDYVADTLALARRVIGVGYARVVYASSAVVYGDKSIEPHRPGETVRPCGAYACAKVAVEQLVQNHAGGVVARLANVYGVGMAHNNVISDILTQLTGSGPIRLRDSTAVRDFISVEDIARGLLAVATGEEVGVYNIGTGIGHSVAEVARMACELAGQISRPAVSISPMDHLSALVLDITSTCADFKWEPMVAMRDGLQELVAKAI